MSHKKIFLNALKQIIESHLAINDLNAVMNDFNRYYDLIIEFLIPTRDPLTFKSAEEENQHLSLFTARLLDKNDDKLVAFTQFEMCLQLFDRLLNILKNKASLNGDQHDVQLYFCQCFFLAQLIGPISNDKPFDLKTHRNLYCRRESMTQTKFHECHLKILKLLGFLSYPDAEPQSLTTNDANYVFEEGMTPLHYAALSNKPVAIKNLIARGANIWAVNEKQWNALEIALNYQNLLAARCLAEHGAVVSSEFVKEFQAPPLVKTFSRDSLENSYLHYVAYLGKKAFPGFSLSHFLGRLDENQQKQTLSHKNNASQTAYEVSIECGHLDLGMEIWSHTLQLNRPLSAPVDNTAKPLKFTNVTFKRPSESPQGQERNAKRLMPT